MTFTRLTDGQLDTLKEISNIGIGHAATALSQMIGEEVFLRVPKVQITDIAEVPDILGGAEQVVVGLTLRMLGDARGSILLIFPIESSQKLISRLLGHGEKHSVLNELGASTLKEVGNILASAYLSALGTLLHLNLIPSVPLLATDMAGAIVDHVLIELSQSGEQALMVETEFFGRQAPEHAIRGHFFLLPDAASLDLLLQAVERR